MDIFVHLTYTAWYFFFAAFQSAPWSPYAWGSQLEKCRTDVWRGRRRRWRRSSAAGSSVHKNNYCELVRNKRQSSNLEIACLSRSYKSLESWLLGNDSTSTSAGYFRYVDWTSRSFDAESCMAHVFVQRPVWTTSSRSQQKFSQIWSSVGVRFIIVITVLKRYCLFCF